MVSGSLDQSCTIASAGTRSIGAKITNESEINAAVFAVDFTHAMASCRITLAHKSTHTDAHNLR